MSGFRRGLIAVAGNKSGGQDNWNTPLTFTAVKANSIIKLTKNGSLTVDGIQYRLGTSGEWSTYTIDKVLTLNNVNDVVQFQNTNESLSIDSSNYVKFVMTGKLAGSGNIQSMLNYSKSCSNYCYYDMFYDCTSLVTAPELQATTLSDSCYRAMFSGCTSLVNPPKLPATTLADYCYSSMFYGCTGLTSAPELPATTLADYCYFAMFSGCTSLVNPPELLATTLASSCYSDMFRGCISLTTAPELPATTLASKCYRYMFAGCKKLVNIKVHFTSWTSDATYYWTYLASSTGTFYKPSVLPAITQGLSYIPSGWTVVNID